MLSSERAMVSQEVKLLGFWLSPFVFRIKVALKFKGVEYEYLEQDLSTKSPLLLDCNPVYKKVPVLIHGGKPINDSFVILEYIEETWKQNPILPVDPYEKAMVRFWAKFAEDKLIEVVRRILLSEGEEQEKQVKQAQESLTVLDGELKDNKFFGGEKIGYLDIVLGFLVHWLEIMEEVAGVQVFESHKFPYFSKWMKELTQVSIIKQNFPPKDEIFAHIQSFRGTLLPSKLT